MRIVYDHQIVGSQEFGGASRYVYELATRMAATHLQDVYVVSPLFANSYVKSRSESLKVIGVPIPRIPRTGRMVLALNSLVARPLIRGLKPDVVHETYYSRRRVAPRSARAVVTVYDMIHERLPQEFRANDPTRRVKAAAVARADHVICISEYTRRDLVELLRVDPAKISVVYLGVALTNETAPVTSMPTRPFLLFVGYRGGYKNFIGLLRAYAASPRLRQTVDIVCFGGGKFTRAEVNLMRNLGVSDERVRHQSGGDALLVAHYRAASALVYPSLYEGFGIPPLEAMSCGCPVVCSDRGSIPEIVAEAGELFDPDEPESMAVAIERVVFDDARRGQLLARGRERIKDFSWARCARETLDVYRRFQSRDT